VSPVRYLVGPRGAGDETGGLIVDFGDEPGDPAEPLAPLVGRVVAFPFKGGREGVGGLGQRSQP
jgi:hypothetical protein